MKPTFIFGALSFFSFLVSSWAAPAKTVASRKTISSQKTIPKTPVSAAPIVLRLGVGKPVSSLKVSSDGKLAFVTANSGQIEVYDLKAPKLLREFRGGMGADELAISPDASEVADGTPHTQFGLGAVGAAASLDWSRDGQMLASASSNQVGLLDRDGKMLAKREGAIGVGPGAVAFSPDGTRLVAGWSDRALTIHDTANFEKTQFAYQGPKLPIVAQLPGHEGAITTLAWSKNGKFLASGDATGQVKIWDFAAQKNLASWTVAGSAIASLSWAPSGASVAVATQIPEGKVDFPR